MFHILRAALIILLLVPGVCHAATLRWAAQNDVRSLDPYAGRETLLRSFDDNIYEPLVRRGRDLALEPALATSGTEIAPDRWRFALRGGVKFQDGTPFTAADVVFSFARARGPGSRIAAVLGAISGVRAIDPRTVEITTIGPDPLLLDQLALLPIMSRQWCEAHRDDAGYIATHADGTGPFGVAERVPGTRTVLAANPSWWDGRVALDRAVFTPIADAQALAAALKAGAVDMIYDVPPQDSSGIAGTPGVALIEGPGLETIFLGFDVARASPWQDRRVREAVAHAVDESTIIADVMRGHASPAGILVGPGVNGYDKTLDTRPFYDPALAQKLLAAAGYPSGFATGLDCPNDRYANDVAICQEVVAELARIGIKVSLDAETRAQFFAKIMPPAHGTYFFLMGQAASFDDAQGTLVALAASRNAALHQGEFNITGYANAALDRLVKQIRVETDPAARVELLHRGLALVKDDLPYLPLHRENIVWAARAGIDLVQRPDDTFALRYVRMR
jgi:peptide/nickel transport system substrate-binding protein